MGDYNVYARLLIDEEEYPISNLRYSAAEGTLGEQCRFDLADPTQVIPDSGEVSVQIGVENPNGVEWADLIVEGQILASTETIKWAADGKGITVVNKVGEKWDLSPTQQIVVYDPEEIDPVEEVGTVQGELVDEDYLPIEPVFIPKADFDLHTLLRYIYVDRLGFAGVVTNVPNYRMNVASIGVTQSFHSVAANELAVFEPKYFMNAAGVLFIIDPQGTLPPSLPVRRMALKHYVDFTRSRQRGRLVNAVILEWTDNFVTGASEPTARTEQDYVEIGTYGTEGWQRTVTTRHIYDFYEDPDRPTAVTRSVVYRVVSNVSAIADGLTRVVSVDDQEDLYKYDYRLKIGYNKTVKLYCTLPGLSAKLRTVQTEASTIVWEQLNSTPGEFVKRWESIEIRGLVLRTYNDPDDPGQGATYKSIYNANRLDEIPEEEEDGTTLLTDRPISTQIDAFRVTGKDQIEVNSQRIDHLREHRPADLNKTFQHTGTIQVRGNGPTSLTTRMVITRGTEPRRTPVVLNAGNVPLSVARTLAERILDREGQEPETAAVELSGLDLSLRRGSLRRALDRDEVEHLLFITGVDIAGENLGQPSFAFTMTANAVKIEE
jgi:hypothetical protein